MIVEIIGSSIIQAGILMAKTLSQPAPNNQETVENIAAQDSSEPIESEKQKQITLKPKIISEKLKAIEGAHTINNLKNLESIQNDLVKNYRAIHNDISKDKFLSDNEIRLITDEKFRSKFNPKTLIIKSKKISFDPNLKAWTIPNKETIEHSRRTIKVSTNKYSNAMGASTTKPTIYQNSKISMLNPAYHNLTTTDSCIKKGLDNTLIYYPSSIDEARKIDDLKSIYFARFLKPYENIYDNIFDNDMRSILSMSAVYITNETGAVYETTNQIVYSEKTNEILIEINEDGVVSALCK